MFDRKLPPYGTAFGHWRLSKFCKSEADQITWKNNRFEGLVNYDERDGNMNLDTLLGAYMCWAIELSCAGYEKYTHEFGDALDGLEYEKDHVWISRINLKPVTFNLQQVDKQHPTDLQ